MRELAVTQAWQRRRERTGFVRRSTVNLGLDTEGGVDDPAMRRAGCVGGLLDGTKVGVGKRGPGSHEHVRRRVGMQCYLDYDRPRLGLAQESLVEDLEDRFHPVDQRLLVDVDVD